MIDIREEKPVYNELILAALTFGKETKSCTEGIMLTDIHDWAPDENGKGGGVTHTIFTRTPDGIFVVTPLEWRPEYADIITHWMPYPEHPALIRSEELWSKELWSRICGYIGLFSRKKGPWTAWLN